MSGAFAGLRRVQDAQVEGQVVAVRVDYNVPMADGQIGDDTRIQASLPTLRLLRERGAKVVVFSHLGRPEGKVVPELSLRPIADLLGELLEAPIILHTEHEEDVRPHIDEAADEAIHVLENVRFHPEETANESPFARWLSSLGDLFVNDAFATLHRAHASTVGVADHLPAYAGLLVQKELEALSPLVEEPKRPYVAVIGGKKAKSKLGPLRDLIRTVDEILVGGGVAYTLLEALGVHVGTSPVEHALLDEVEEVLANAGERGVTVLLPSDVVTAEAPEAASEAEIFAVDEIPPERSGFNIGPETVARFAERIAGAGSVLWTGPMGMYEDPAFASGTRGLAEAMAATDAYTVVGGGETGDAVSSFGLAESMSHISTGGGASLALLRGRRLPALEALRES
ncbi:MAG: phosphoglycerate kinase [Candidatus Bipolaricaulota bacterium]|nr:MAG: phosphoglycerate kinase [Candidatus Bipolaricaulota bacterium]